MKKLLITGSSGMLGSNIISQLKGKYDIFGIDRYCPKETMDNQFSVDITRSEEVAKALGRIRPDFVVHCAAITDVDKCESDYSLAYETNAKATKDLILNLGPQTRLIYISTDSVFDGKRGGYRESDPPSPLNNYAKSKLEGERFVERFSKDYAIIRTNIFGWNRVRGISFAEWVFNSLSQKRPIKMFTDVVFSPITVNTLSRFIDRLLGMNFIGRLNIGSGDLISKYDFGIKLAELFSLDGSLITPVSIDTFEFKAKRPKDTSLNVSKAESVFGPLPSVADELLKFRSEYDKLKLRRKFYVERQIYNVKSQI